MDAITPLQLERPKLCPNVFAEGLRAQIHEFLQKPGWETGWRSNSNRDAFTFLHKHFAGYRKNESTAYDCALELAENSALLAAVWRGLAEGALAGHTLVRCYANGMMYGTDGTVHTDSQMPGSTTFVYYPHARWSPNWGGETIFYNQEETNIIAVCYPTPNAAVLFDGRIPHRANGVTRLFPGVRITLMFKTKTPPQPSTMLLEKTDAGAAQ